jgi:hypothetical protein
MDEAAKHLLNQFAQVCLNPMLCPEDWQRLYRLQSTTTAAA